MRTTENLLFLYLDTGGGHAAPAHVLKNAIENRSMNMDSDYNVFCYNGFARTQIMSRFLYETNYHLATNYIDGAWFLIYELTRSPLMLSLLRALSYVYTPYYIESLICKHRITRIVSFHFALTPSAVRAAQRAARHLQAKIEVSVIITDPFTTHCAWYLEKDLNFIVFSSALKDSMIKQQGIDASRIRVMSCLIDPKFYTHTQMQRTFLIPPAEKKRKTILITGGGEGLPHSLAIVREVLCSDNDFLIVLVCGRNKMLKKCAEKLAAKEEILARRRGKSVLPRLKVYGFVNTMSDLLKECDCVISKPGASTLFEVIACHKPVIFSTFLHGQELGNVRFAVENGIGWFIRSPKAILKKVQQLFEDASYYERMSASYDTLNVRFDLEEYLSLFLGTAPLDK